jgi:predicted ATP-dependent endonuclease of OLD family
MPTEKYPGVYLNNVHFSGYKSIVDLNIDFQKGLNILIGKNGAGKSNFMSMLMESFRHRRNSKTPFLYAAITLISEDGHRFELEQEKTAKIIEDESGYKIDKIDRLIIDGELQRDSSIGQNIGIFKNKKVTHKGSIRLSINRLGYRLAYPLYIRFNLPNNLDCLTTSATLQINLEPPFSTWFNPDSLHFIEDIFSNFEISYDAEAEINTTKRITHADIRKYLKIQSKITENIKRYTPIEDLRFNSTINIYNEEKSIIIDNIKLEFKLNGTWLPWSQLSDGTKRLFYIVSEVTHADSLILLEEPELGIHPHQFNLLMDFLKEQSEEKQIILSTHSPKALDHLSADELNHILITYYDLSKGTQIRHLSDKEVKKAKKYMKEVGFFSDYWMHSDLE